jgi:hypothetical protein
MVSNYRSQRPRDNGMSVAQKAIGRVPLLRFILLSHDHSIVLDWYAEKAPQTVLRDCEVVFW